MAIDQILKAQNLVVEAGNVGDAIVQEKGGAAAKIAHVVELFDEVMAMGSFSFAEFKTQVAGLGDAEKAELLAQFKTKFNIADDKAEAGIEGALALGLKAEALVEEVIAFAKALKA